MALITGTPGNDTLNGTTVDDTLNGLGGNDILNGLGGIDILIGGTGTDFMFGGIGNDTYEVTDAGDVVQENSSEGIDTIWTSVNYALSNTSEVENLMFGGLGVFIGTGNDLNNLIVGGAGNDTLNGGAGNDTLIGNAGNDILIGGTGTDFMFGGIGNDTYEVTDAGDVVQENSSEGIDTITTSVNYALNNTSEVENLIFGGVGNFIGSGNALNNRIVGGTGVDTLTGLGGIDILIGGAGTDFMFGGIGADTYEVTDAGDVVQENSSEGIDTIWTSVNYALNDTSEVENLIFGGSGNFTGSGNIFNNLIVGGAGADTLAGNAGADTLTGNAGTDTQTGGSGADTFVLTTLADSGVGALRDVIMDFVSGTDRIDFSGIDANSALAGNQAFTSIGTAAFTVGVAGQLRYDVVGGITVLQGDVDGIAGADFELQLTGVQTFVAADLVL